MVEEESSSKHHGSFNMKFILLLLFLTYSLFGININESLLSVHATLVPKIPLMDYKFQEKVPQKTIHIVIFYDKNDYRNAKLFEKKIHAKYDKGIKEYPIKTTLHVYNKKQAPLANLYYLLPSNKKNISNVIKMGAKNSIITFSYSPKDLADGAMISLLIGTKVQPIINLKALKANSITFRPIFLKISTIYKNQEKE